MRQGETQMKNTNNTIKIKNVSVLCKLYNEFFGIGLNIDTG